MLMQLSLSTYKNIIKGRFLFALVFCLALSACDSDKKEEAKEGAVQKAELKAVVSSAQSVLLSADRVKAANEYYEEIKGSDRPANSEFEAIERKVNAKRNFDQKEYWSANWDLRRVLVDNPQDFQTWFFLIKTLSGILEFGPQDREKKYLENALTKAMESAKSNVDKAVILWTASRSARELADLRNEALKLASQKDIEARVIQLLGQYPTQFAPYFLDIPQRTDVGSACVSWTYPLLKTEYFKYEDYVSVSPEVSDLAVLARGNRLCVEGLAFGEYYKLTLKQGFPGDNNIKLDKENVLQVYVPHRKPTIRFRERGYILSSQGPQIVPIVAVNVPKVNVRILHVPERNIQEIQRNWFNNTFVQWEARELRDQKGELVWKGTYDCAGETNKTGITGLPIEKMIGEKLKPGVYLVEAYIQENSYGDEYASQALVISDIGLSTYKGPDGMHVFARSLTSAQPLENVELTLIASNNRQLATVTTDSKGYAVFSDKIIVGEYGNSPSFIEASVAGREFTVLSLKAESFDLTDRGVHGRKPTRDFEGYLFSDRGVYRPGEKARLIGLLRDSHNQAVIDTPLTLKIFRPDGVEAQSILLKDAGAGSYLFEYPVSSTALSGVWSATIYVDPKGEEIGRTNFKVQEFVPPRIEVEAKEKAAVMMPKKAGAIDVKVRYYFGPPGANLKVTSESQLVSVENFFPQWQGYSFGLEEEKWVPQKIQLPSITTDEKGQAAIITEVDVAPETTHLLQMETEVTAFEAGGQGRSAKVIVPFWHQDYVIGIAPRFKDKMAQSDTTAVFDIIAVNEKGDLQAKEGLKYSLVEEQHDFVWFQADSRWQYELVIRDRSVASGNVSLDGKKPAGLELSLHHGRYKLEVLDPKTGIASSLRFTAGWVDTVDVPGRPDMLEVKLDQTSYAPGDKARVFIQAGFEGELFLAAAGKKFSSIYAGKIDKEGTTLDITLKEELFDIPGSYLVATAYRPGDSLSSQMPTRAIGVAWLDLKKSAPKVELALEAPKIVKPGSKFEVNVTVPTDRPNLHIALVAVDEAILSLVDYQSPDPFEYFFAQTKLAFDIRDSYGYLINPYGARPGTFNVGGDGLNSRALAKLAARPFKIVALFSGILETKGQETITVPFEVPEFSGKLRVMAIAWDDKAVGSSVTDLIVRDDIDLYLALPRFFAPNDVAQVPLIVHNIGKKQGDFQVKITTSKDTFEQNFTLKEGEQAQQPVSITFDKPGIEKIQTLLNGPEDYKLQRSWDISVRSIVQPMVIHKYGHLKPTESVTLDSAQLSEFQPYNSHLAFSVGAVPDFNSSALVNELMEYPFVCLEQITSRLLATSVALKQGNDKCTADKDSCANTVTNGLNQLLSLQKLDGSFSLWSLIGPTEPWLSIYAADILFTLKQYGTSVPDILTSRLLQWMKEIDQRNNWDINDLPIASYAYYVLAKTSQGTIGRVRYFADNNQLNLTSRLNLAFIAGAYAHYGENELAEKWFNKAIAAVSDDKEREKYFGSDLRDTAVLVTILAETYHQHPKLMALVTELVDKAMASKFLSTQEKAWLIRAAIALKESGKGFEIAVDNEMHKGPEPFKQVYDMKGLDNPIVVTNTSQNPLYYALSVSGSPVDIKKVAQEGFEVERNLYNLNGEPIDLDNIETGKLYMVSIKGRRLKESIKNVVLVDLLPAGFAIEKSLLSEKTVEQYYSWLGSLTSASRIEGRDDRFVAMFELNTQDDFSTAYLVRATTAGEFTFPATYLEAMYQPQYLVYGAEQNIKISDEKK